MSYPPKLTDRQRAAIAADERSYRTIGADYGVSQTVVYWIKKGRPERSDGRSTPRAPKASAKREAAPVALPDRRYRVSW